LKTKGIEYEEKNIAQGYNIQDLLELVPNAKTMPQIWLDEEHIGGFSDLKEKLQG
jgi:glutaredoxin